MNQYLTDKFLWKSCAPERKISKLRSGLNGNDCLSSGVSSMIDQRPCTIVPIGVSETAFGCEESAQCLCRHLENRGNRTYLMLIAYLSLLLFLWINRESIVSRFLQGFYDFLLNQLFSHRPLFLRRESCVHWKMVSLLLTRMLFLKWLNDL